MLIHTLDLHYQKVPQAIAAYLVIGPSGPVLVETGPGSTLNTLTAQLADHGYTPQDIKHVLVSHIHFDHAGAAGWWAQQGAHVYVHHIGARHLIDPSRLIASATRIYGQMMDVLWGDILPAPAENVTAVYDGDKIEVAGLTFTALSTPGHATHHHVYRLGHIAFIGDAGGLRLPHSPFLDLPAPPPEFNPEVWQQTIDRLVDEKFSAIYPTHFGRVDDVDDHWRGFRALVAESAEFVRKQMQTGAERGKIIKQYETWNRQRALDSGISKEMIHRYETANPLYMSVDGIMRYWRKKGI